VAADAERTRQVAQLDEIAKAKFAELDETIALRRAGEGRRGARAWFAPTAARS
jgi:CHASE3 domain sensor protein